MFKSSRNSTIVGGTHKAEIKLPDLGRKDSHSITPASNVRLNQLDLKLKDQLAKNSFMHVDDKALQQARTNGHTPKLASTNAITPRQDPFTLTGLSHVKAGSMSQMSNG